MKSGMYLERVVIRQPNVAVIVVTIGDSGDLHVMKKGRAETLTRYDNSVVSAPKIVTENQRT